MESGDFPGPRIFTAGISIFPAHALPYYLADLPPNFKAKMVRPETPVALDDDGTERAMGFESLAAAAAVNKEERLIVRDFAEATGYFKD